MYKIFYYYVGGLGGFGLELANWLISRGAKKIILSSASGVRTGFQAFQIRKWEERNIKILISLVDCTNEKGAEQLLKEAELLGPVGGIFNLAAVSKTQLHINFIRI